MTNLVMLSSKQVCELGGCTYRQLDYWARLGWITPEVQAEGSGTQRRWSPQAVDIVRVLAAFSRMTTLGGNLGKALAEHPEGPWVMRHGNVKITVELYSDV